MQDTVKVATVSQQMAQVNIGIEASQSFRGQFRGQSVIPLPPSTLSLMESAKEELSFAVSDRMGQGLSKRKFGKETRIHSHAMEQADAYLKRVPDLDKQAKLKNFVSRFIKPPIQTAAQLRQAARQMGKDPTLQYAALGYLKSLLIQEQKRTKRKNSGESAMAMAAEEAMEQLMNEEGPAINAGLNISETAAEFSGNRLGDTQSLRGFYRDSVLDYQDITSAYKKIINEFGEKDFNQSLKFLLKALGADFSAQNSSIEPARLQQIIDDMFVVKVLGGIHEQTSQLVLTLKQFFQQVQCADGHTLMMQMLDLKEHPFPTAEAVFALVKIMKIRGGSEVIYFLQALKELLRLIPEKAYNGNSDRRIKLLIVVQDALDNAIDREEEVGDDDQNPVTNEDTP